MRQPLLAVQDAEIGTASSSEAPALLVSADGSDGGNDPRSNLGGSLRQGHGIAARSASFNRARSFRDSDIGHSHYSHRSPWLRAALLGSNDGLVSITSLMLGVGAVETSHTMMIISGLSGLIAGACSMAIGEYISVYGQRDSEEADLQKEREEFEKGPEAVARELRELTQIYVARGVPYDLARQVAEALHESDPIRAHAREELGIDLDDLSDPGQAAVVSAISFFLGGITPLLSGCVITDYNTRITVLIALSTVLFIALGALGAWLGGAPQARAAVRTTVGGWLAMAITYAVVWAFGASGV
ncbi:hypothetical protein CLOM_g24161 [Closterium sp. NIES-68]|nr:hypothetical protein CLOM_g3109 [Closterium sp. NIES-68]GJP39821.1 hypothetical protein CLOM_g24161 [Closterium sp. NIES-68]GJP86598.1 hypothetical protein CLOP_g16600 [Closterium sp. NIES-67]